MASGKPWLKQVLISLLIPLLIGAPLRPVFAGGMPIGGGSSCQSDCVDYKGVEHGQRPGQSQSELEKQQARTAILAQHCDVIDQATGSRDLEILTLATYGLASVICAVACLVPLGVDISQAIAAAVSETVAGSAVMEAISGVGTAASAYGPIACTIAGGVATVSDIAASAKLLIDGIPAQKFWANVAGGMGLGTAALGGAGTTAAGGGGAISQGARVGSQVATQSSSETAQAGGSAAQGSTTTAGSIASCAAMGFFLTVTMIKVAALLAADGIAENSCQAIKKMKSEAMAVSPGATNRPPQAPLPGQQAAPGGSAPPLPAGEALEEGLREQVAKIVPEHLDFDRSKTAGATAKSLFDKMPNKAKLEPFARKYLKMTPREAAFRILSSEGVSGLFGDSEKLPKGLSKALRELEFQAKSGGLESDGIAAYVSGKKGLAPSAGSELDKPESMELRGHRYATTFQKVAVAPELTDDGDIWHAKYPGTIFDIATRRIGKSRDRVDKLDWLIPINRASVGLPAGR